ncbi:unnamed protein product [Auanema sp. JU1783]|nr:unnamed protein product [Auanema sp. JU1783]
MANVVSPIIIFLAIVIPLHSRFCVDDKKGFCKGHDIWGWCFHNKTSGKFDCDEANFCVGQETLKNKKNSGCFVRDNSTVCCCNDADGCNLGFIPVSPKYASGQSCYNSVEEPNEDARLFKPCDDPWCFAFLSADAEGGLTTVQRGCHSRKLVLHHMSLEEDKKHHNNSRWRDTEALASQPTCEDIAMDASTVNGTQSLCLDFQFDQDGTPRKGRLCCCRGSSKCNEKFLWADAGITKDELIQIQEERGNALGNGCQQITTLTISTLISSFAVLLSLL